MIVHFEGSNAILLAILNGINNRAWHKVILESKKSKSKHIQVHMKKKVDDKNKKIKCKTWLSTKLYDVQLGSNLASIHGLSGKHNKSRRLFTSRDLQSILKYYGILNTRNITSDQRWRKITLYKRQMMRHELQELDCAADQQNRAAYFL